MYEWLRDYQKLEDEIAYLENNLERTTKELNRWTSGDLAKFKLTADSDGAKLEEHIIRIEYELAHRMNDVHDLKRTIASFRGLEHKILYKKYIEGMTLECVAEELKYSSQYIYNKHAQIKRMIDYAQTANI